MLVTGRLDQLRGNAHPITGLAHTAFQHIAYAQLLADLAHIGGLAFVGEAGIARHHAEFLKACQFGDQVLGQAVGEIILLGITAHIFERQHRDGGQQDGRTFLPRSRNDFWLLLPFGCRGDKGINRNRLGDVFDRFLALKTELARQFSFNMLVDGGGQRDAAWRR